MRIIAGTARGTKLTAPAGQNTRPTSDRVREALFNIIADRLHGAMFLDLFAGSGAVGLEALSRGAGFAVFADIKQECARIIRRNAEKIKLEDKTRILHMEAEKAVSFCAREVYKFDIIYLDPPYETTFITEALTAMEKSEIIAPNALIVAEHGGSEICEVVAGFTVSRVKRYGDTVLTFITKHES